MESGRLSISWLIERDSKNKMNDGGYKVNNGLIEVGSKSKMGYVWWKISNWMIKKLTRVRSQGT